MPKVIRRHGAYVTFASASLARCVSATLTVFTFVNALWLRPLPFPDAERIVTIVADAGDTDVAYGTFDRQPDGWPMFEVVAGQGTASGAFAS